MQNYIKTILSAFQTWTQKKIKDSTADWNENDSSANNYVKNRTHWEEKKLIYLVPEMTVFISEDGGYETLSESCPILMAGQAYTVVLNGVTYKCIARQYQHSVLIGNGTIYGDGDAENNEPFSCDSYDDGTIYLNAAIAGNYTISISTIETITHKLDKKYLDLPDNIATTDDVESAKWEALDVANTAAANAATAQITADSKMNATNPVGTGSFNMNQSQVSDYAISLGYKNKATGKYSHADGYYTKTLVDYQHVGGKYNIEEIPFLKYEENNYSLSIDLGVSVYISNGYEDDQITGTFNLKKPQQVLSENLPTNTAYFFALSNNSDTIYLHYAKETTIEVSSDKVIISNATKTSFIQNSCKAHIVGNGTSNTARSNAHTLDWEGNAWYSGDVYVGSTSGTNRDEGSKKLATVEEVQELASQISPQPYVAQTEAPEDKNLLWLDLDDESDDEGLADAIQAAIADVKNVAIPVPEVAKVGQTIVVKEIDEDGKPTAWEAVNLPSGDSVPEKVEFTKIAEGIIPKGTDNTIAIDTGVTWADIKDYDWFEIAVYASNGWGATGPFYFYNWSTVPEAWRRIMIANGPIGKSRFKRVANGVYEWFHSANTVATCAPTLSTVGERSMFTPMGGPESVLINLGRWKDTDKFYIYTKATCVVDMTFTIAGINFK